MLKLVSENGRWATKDNDMIFSNVVWLMDENDAKNYHLIDEHYNDFKIDTITEISNNKEQPKEITKHLNQTVMPSHSDEEINKLKKIRTNNVFITASKINKESFSINWNELKKDIKYKNSDLYSKIEDAEVEIVSDNIAVLSINTETAVYLFNSNLETIEEEYNTKFNKQYKIICLLKQECTKAKEEYIKNKNKKYVYMEENLSEIATKEIATDEKSNSAFEIFGKDLIEIK